MFDAVSVQRAERVHEAGRRGESGGRLGFGSGLLRVINGPWWRGWRLKKFPARIEGEAIVITT
jgi:hypothetical protein